MKITYKPLYDQFKYGHSHDIRLTSHAKSFHVTHTKKHVTQPRKYHVTQNKNYHNVPPINYHAKPKFNQNLRKSNKDPRNCGYCRTPIFDLVFFYYFHNSFASSVLTAF